MNSFLILGITREAILHIFDAIEQETDKQFLLRVSYMEIYNEEVKDLLASKNGEKRRKSQALKVLDDSDGSVNIIGNTMYRNSYATNLVSNKRVLEILIFKMSGLNYSECS